LTARAPAADGLRHHGIDLGLARDIVTDGEFGRAAAGLSDAGVMGDVGAFEDRELQAVPQIEEGDSAVLELLADDAFGRKPQSVSVEFERRLQIIDTKRDDTDASFHFGFSFLYSGLEWYR
jgi:hypothetical protein